MKNLGYVGIAIVGTVLVVGLILLFGAVGYQPTKNDQVVSRANNIQDLESRNQNLVNEIKELRVQLVEEKSKRVDATSDWADEKVAKMKCQDELSELKRKK